MADRPQFMYAAWLLPCPSTRHLAPTRRRDEVENQRPLLPIHSVSFSLPCACHIHGRPELPLLRCSSFAATTAHCSSHLAASSSCHRRWLPLAATAGRPGWAQPPPWPSKTPSRFCHSAVPNHRRHSRVHYRLRLIVIHLTHMLARAKHRQSAAAAMPHGCKPPAHVAEPPRAISGQATSTGGCAR
jgi:hypothetical protein